MFAVSRLGLPPGLFTGSISPSLIFRNAEIIDRVHYACPIFAYATAVVLILSPSCPRIRNASSLHPLYACISHIAAPMEEACVETVFTEDK